MDGVRKEVVALARAKYVTGTSQPGMEDMTPAEKLDTAADILIDLLFREEDLEAQARACHKKAA